MSIKFALKDDKFEIISLQLPTRYKHFFEKQNYIKLLSLSDGIFPKDNIKVDMDLDNSDLILANESATKVYPSSKEYAINSYDIKLRSSNLEFINDELILYENARYKQRFLLDSDEESTFFYADILSNGRSDKRYFFDKISQNNIFFCDGKKEYMENYELSGSEIKKYLKNDINTMFVKFYIKCKDSHELMRILEQNQLYSFAFSQNKKMIIGAYSFDKMSKLKDFTHKIWKIYREFFDKKVFDLGKY